VNGSESRSAGLEVSLRLEWRGKGAFGWNGRGAGSNLSALPESILEGLEL
jgi:hypothetical protein